MNEVCLHFDLFNGKLMIGYDHERNLYHPEKRVNEKSNIEDLFKSLCGSSTEKSPKYFKTGISRKRDDHTSDMAVSACVSGPVFGDTVCGTQSQRRSFFVFI